LISRGKGKREKTPQQTYNVAQKDERPYFADPCGKREM